jgi:hypothetical protein
MPSSCSEVDAWPLPLRQWMWSTYAPPRGRHSKFGRIPIGHRQESSYSFHHNHLFFWLFLNCWPCWLRTYAALPLASLDATHYHRNVYGPVIVPNHNNLCWIGEIVWTNCVELRMVQTFLLFRPEPPWKYQIWITNSSELNQIRSEPNRTTEKN